MNIDASLYQLMSWMSPSYPVGAFTFSQGIETAVESGRIPDADTAQQWIRDLLWHGSAGADLVFLAQAWGAAGSDQALDHVRKLALAFLPTSELRLESTAQGDAFLRACADAWSSAARLPGTWPYPVAVGYIAKRHAIDKRLAMVAFAQALVSNLVSAAVRLVPLGQTDGQRVIAALMPDTITVVSGAMNKDLDDVSTSTIVAEICSMQHETQYTRLFRS